MSGFTSAASLLRSARRSAGMSQRELAHLAGTAQSVIARIENGSVSPSWKTLAHLVSSAGFRLQAVYAPRSAKGSHMLNDVQRILSLSPEERLLELRNAARFIVAARRIADGRV